MQGWGASQPEGEREEEYSLTLTFKHLQRLIYEWCHRNVARPNSSNFFPDQLAL